MPKERPYRAVSSIEAGRGHLFSRPFVDGVATCDALFQAWRGRGADIESYAAGAGTPNNYSDHLSYIPVNTPITQSHTFTHHIHHVQLSRSIEGLRHRKCPTMLHHSGGAPGDATDDALHNKHQRNTSD